MDRSDLIKNFLEEKTEIKPDVKVGASELYQSYKYWASGDGYKPMSRSQFKATLIEKTGLDQTREKTGNYWYGIKLLDLYL
ncbi:MAG: hypothetical protein COA81_13510 [Alphaproteobacteria bacterium]|nr:MAG: hypothetical protein COA81_13510 [Alphaproteobacteria bacterium]